MLGLGRIGAFHAETLTSLPVVEELVVADPVAALAEEAAGRFGAQIADSPEAVLASGVDGVVIAAPPTSPRAHRPVRQRTHPPAGHRGQ